MRVIIGCERSGVIRRAFRDRGHDAWSCDIAPAVDGSPHHFQCDLLTVLGKGWDLMIAHPECTYLTGSAEWAYADPNFERYPDKGGYHQQVKPGTLVGAARREAREQAKAFVFALRDSGIPRIAIENPVGHLSTAWRSPDQIIQPYEFGDDASKKTALWLVNLPRLVIDPMKRKAGRKVIDPRTGKVVERWANQTDGGQNILPPTDDRAERRSETYPGIAAAIADQWGESAPRPADGGGAC